VPSVTDVVTVDLDRQWRVPSPAERVQKKCVNRWKTTYYTLQTHSQNCEKRLLLVPS